MDKRLCFLALGAALLAACSGNNQQNSSSTTTSSSTTAPSPAATIAAMKSAATSGATVYNTNCSSCHQTNGKGQAGAFPPLAGNSVVTGNPSTVIHIVKNGLTGKIKVGSQTFNGMMPAWKNTLKPGDIAAVVTYIRSSWGNHASAVTVAQVNATK